MDKKHDLKLISIIKYCTISLLLSIFIYCAMRMPVEPEVVLIENIVKEDALTLKTFSKNKYLITVNNTNEFITLPDSINEKITQKSCYKVNINPIIPNDTILMYLEFNLDSFSIDGYSIPFVLASKDKDGECYVIGSIFEIIDSLNILKAEIAVVLPTASNLQKESNTDNLSLLFEIVFIKFPNDEIQALNSMKIISTKENFSPDTLVIFVHGLFSSYTIWEKIVEPYRNYPIVYIHYSWSRHISSNGKALNELLKNNAYCRNAKAIYFVTHSMGGLVARKAIYEGIKYNESWASKVKKLILFSSPSDGGKIGPIPLYKILNPYIHLPIVGGFLLLAPGILDLKWGYMNEDWLIDGTYRQNVKSPVKIPTSIEIHATVCNGDPVVSIESAFDILDGKDKDDLEVLPYRMYSPDVNFKETKSVLIPKQDYINFNDKFQLIWNLMNNKIDMGLINPHLIIYQNLKYLIQSSAAHGSYNLTEGKRLLKQWLNLLITETWQSTAYDETHTGEGHFIFKQRGDGPVSCEGTYLWGGYLESPYVTGSVTISGSTISFTGIGDALNLTSQNTSLFTLDVNGTCKDGKGEGTWICDFKNPSWNDGFGNWNATRIEGYGITEESFLLSQGNM